MSPPSEHDMMVEYEQRLSAQAAQIVKLTGENAELTKLNYELSELLRRVAITVAQERDSLEH